jgi:hypothetical protein
LEGLAITPANRRNSATTKDGKPATFTGSKYHRTELFLPKTRGEENRLKELIPEITRIAVLVNPGNPVVMGAELQAMETAAQSLRVERQQVLVRGPSEFESAFD